MLEINNVKRTMPRRRSAQTGVAAVEFALVALVFFLLVFGIIEVARMMYVFNTLQESTRRAAATAANTSFNARDKVAQQAVFRDSPGGLIAGYPVTDANIRIDYLWLDRGNNGTLTLKEFAGGTPPACGALSRLNCLANPHSSSCVRFVRVRVCQTGDADACAPVRYQTLFSLVDLPTPLPIAQTIVPAESLGAAGPGPCGP